MAYQVICALGDSITNGYWDEDGLGWFGRLSMRIAKTYPYKFGFNNLAVAGDKSTHVLARLAGETLLRKPDIVLIAVGVNDIIRTGDRKGPFDMSMDYTLRNWEKIIALAKANVPKTVIISLLPIEESQPSEEEVTDSALWNNNADIDFYNAKLQKLAENNGMPYLDISNIWEGFNLSDFLYDGIHPNAKGHQAIADHVFTELEKLELL